MKRKQKCAILFLPPDPIHFGRIGCLSHLSAELIWSCELHISPAVILFSQRTPNLEPNLTSDTIYDFQQPRIPRAADFFFSTVALHDNIPPQNKKSVPRRIKSAQHGHSTSFSLRVLCRTRLFRKNASRKSLILRKPLAILWEICYTVFHRGMPVFRLYKECLSHFLCRATCCEHVVCLSLFLL